MEHGFSVLACCAGGGAGVPLAGDAQPGGVRRHASEVALCRAREAAIAPAPAAGGFSWPASSPDLGDQPLPCPPERWQRDPSDARPTVA